jgi:preprotein translocase subunit SecF
MIDLVGKRGWFYLISIVMLLPGLISLVIPPSLKTGIDFSSGSTFTVRFERPIDRDALQDALADLDHSEARIQSTGENEFLVRTKELAGATSAPAIGPARGTEREAIEDALRDRFGNMLDSEGNTSDTQGFLDFSSISATVSGGFGFTSSPPFVASGITGHAISAIIFASVAILLYLWYSFRAVPQAYRFGTAAVIALLHDALIVLGVFSILGKTFDIEITKDFIVAILTVIGFSVHDSIVVFDRIRETVLRGEGRSFAEAVNNSLLQTMARSLNTSLTLVFSILALLLIGGDSIRDFLIALLVGVITGAYSSVFVASQILVSWDEGDVPRIWRRLTGRPSRQEELQLAPEA